MRRADFPAYAGNGERGTDEERGVGVWGCGVCALGFGSDDVNYLDQGFHASIEIEKMAQNLKFNLDVLQKKARERTVKTQDIEYDLETLLKRVQSNVIKLDPDYQRRHRWTDETSSRLIESLILNIPVPTIFISQDIDVDDENDPGVARYTVIDGQQRLTAIVRFLENDLALEGLQALSELNGALRRDLPPFLARRLEERTLRCLRIDSTLDPQVKYDIFERLNTGSVKLEPQELRTLQ